MPHRLHHLNDRFSKHSHHFLLVRLGQRLGHRGWKHLRDSHLLEHLDGKVLEAADVDGALLGRGQVAAADAEVARGAHHAAGQPQGVVRENGLWKSKLKNRPPELQL